MKILIASVFWFSALFSARAQSPAPSPIPPMPDGPPILLRAVDHSQWTIAISQNQPSSTPAAGAKPAAANKPYLGSQTTVTKTGKLICRQTHDDQGALWSTWCVGEIQFTIYPSGKVLAQTRPADVGYANPFYVDYSQTDFPDFWWVSAKTYAGIQNQAGKACIYFKDHIKFYKDDDTASDVEAYVDLKTRYPVLLTVNGTSHTYTFSASPPPDLELPDAVKTVIQQRAKSTTIATRKIPSL